MTYDPTAYPQFAVTVDLVALTLRNGALSVLVVERGEEPFRGTRALPGGFVRPDESAADAASRELSEETGLSIFPGYVEQLGTYSEPDRDPRMRVVSIAYVAFAPDLPEPVAGTDAAAASWMSVDDVRDLGFDHDTILADAIERVRSKLEYTTLATNFVTDPFTIRDLQSVYETVWGTTLDRANFRRKVLGTTGFVEPVDGVTTATGRRGRNAQVYRSGRAESLHPPILRAPM